MMKREFTKDGRPVYVGTQCSPPGGRSFKYTEDDDGNIDGVVAPEDIAPANWAAYRAVTKSIDDWNRRLSGGRAVMGQRAVAAMSAVRRGDNPWSPHD